MPRLQYEVRDSRGYKEGKEARLIARFVEHKRAHQFAETKETYFVMER